METNTKQSSDKAKRTTQAPSVKVYTEVKPGCTVKVYQRIKEGKKERVQAFEGLVIARKHGSQLGATITVRREVSGIGVERVYPVHSPLIEKIEVLRHAKVRRAKLYYLRSRVGRRLRLKEKVVKKTAVKIKPAIKVVVDKDSATTSDKV